MWCGLSVNLECRSEMCCTRLAGNTERKKIAICTPLHNFAWHFFATKACINYRKSLLNSNISSRCPDNMANFGPLMAEICWRVSGIAANFSGFHVLALLLSWRSLSQPTKLCMIFGCLLGWYTIYTFSGLLPPDGNLPGAKFTLHPSLVFSYWHSHCSALQQWVSAKLCGVV